MDSPSTTPRAAGAAIRWTLFIVIFLSGAASLAWGLRWVGDRAPPAVAPQYEEDRIDHHATAVGLGASLLAASLLLFIVHRREHGAWRAEMLAFGEAVDALGPREKQIDLALASVLGLFLEVALIRWHGAEFRACAYLKNITLLACFLGLGLGFARARRPVVAFPIVLLLLAAQVLTMDFLSLADADRAVRNPVGSEVFWGMGNVTNALQAGVFYGFFAALFVSTIVIFIPIGQLTGRLMVGSRPIRSYTINIAGSILGVLIFALVSYLWLPPAIWFGISAAIALWLMRQSRRGLAMSGVLAALMIAWLGFEPRAEVKDIYSPYQRLEVSPYRATTATGVAIPVGVRVAANKTFYLHALNLAGDFAAKWKDRIAEIRDKMAAYELPYRLGPKPARVLIVGAGAGNDVAAAVRAGVGQIDAVEIDPAIAWVGRTYHPEAPYDAAGVHVFIRDARAYMKRAAPGQYDLIVFGLLDSHALLSGMTAIRLDNFVYTIESMKEARRLLRPGGRLCLSFAVKPDGPFSLRMYEMLETAFGRAPRAFLLQGTDTLFAIGAAAGDVAVAGELGETPEATGELAAAARQLRVPPSEDDWPFPFLPGRTWAQFPRAYVYLVEMLSLISVVWVLASRERGAGGLSGQFFFLGGAFLLIETKGITELALVFGTTWVVSSVVILSILTLILLANWFVSVFPPRGLTTTYLCLFASLLAGYFVPLHGLLESHWLIAAIVAPLLLCLPLFFAGIIFAKSLKSAPSLSGAFASNLLGAILGGFCEYTSMVWGFRALGLLAMGLYLLAWLSGRRSASPGRVAG